MKKSPFLIILFSIFSLSLADTLIDTKYPTSSSATWSTEAYSSTCNSELFVPISTSSPYTDSLVLDDTEDAYRVGIKLNTWGYNFGSSTFNLEFYVNGFVYNTVFGQTQSTATKYSTCGSSGSFKDTRMIYIDVTHPT